MTTLPQQLTIAPAVLQSVGKIDGYVSNIISLGPVVFLNSLERANFTSPVTLTIPAPHRVKGQHGHLVVVSVRPDNTCVPCSTGYQSSRREVTLTTWHMMG
ncbi:hypothetical protein BaRGS_00028137 [Batillaria attramentaria]|uniref:Uncharacterized protein n=1 Tax=Batillaria attramentaria TaxID=370345 RepID=A0ABD0JZX5_9CAEN